MSAQRPLLHFNLTAALTLGAAALVLGSASFAQAQARVGQPAPEFNLPSVSDGKTVALKSLTAKNKAVLVLFVAVKCPVSNGYNDRMEAIARDYSKRGVAVVGINSNKTEPVADIAAHAAQHGFTFAVVKDEGSKVADLYGAQHTPEAFVVDAKGKLVYHGRIDERLDDPAAVKSPDLKNALDDLLGGGPVKVAETKAFGCSIKR